jgi:CBS domain-containing protein
MRCDEIMTKNPATLTRDASAQDAARLMAERDVGFVPVVDQNGTVAGVLTDRDLTIRVLAKGQDGRSVKVSELISGNVVTCPVGSDTSQCRRMMSENKIQRLVIVDESKRPVGIVSLQDLAQAPDSDNESEVGKTVKQVKQDSASVH